MEEYLIALLLSDNGVSSKVSNRVWPGSMPQGSRRPAVVVNMITGAPEYVDEGESGISQSRVQVDSWADSYSAAKELARAVKALLSALSDGR